METISWSRTKIALLAALMLWALYGYPLLLNIPLFDPDEGLHAAIAQEMLESGDWITPRFYGFPFLDKPPFYFWCQAGSMGLFGLGTSAVRLPGMLFSVLAVLSTGALGWRLFDREIGLLAGFFQATTILPLALTQAPIHDVASAALLNLAVLGLWEATTAGVLRRAGLFTLLAGLALGGACLNKGLLLIVSVVITFGGYFLATRRFNTARVLPILFALLIAGLVGAPWYLMMESRNPGYLRYFFLERHLGGFVTSAQPHGKAPWWYYLPVLLGGGLPWILYLPAALRDLWETRTRWWKQPGNQPLLLIWIWLVGYTGFLCIAQSKLVTYLLPVFPALSILIANSWMRVVRGQVLAPIAKAFSTMYRCSTLANPIILPATLILMQRLFHVRYPAWVVVVCILAGFSSWLLQRGCDLKNIEATVVRAGIVISILFVIGITLIVPSVAERTSGRALAEYFNRQGRLPDRLVFAESRFGSALFYLDPKLRAGVRRDQFHAIGVHLWREDLLNPPGTALAIPLRRIPTAAKRADLQGLPSQELGRYRLFDGLQVADRMAQAAGKSSPALR